MVKKKRSTLSRKVFWGIFGVMMILSLALIFSLSNSNSFVGRAVQRIDFAKSGSEIMMEVRGVEGLQYSTIYFNQQSTDVIVNINNITGLAFDGKVYSQFNVNSEKASQISKIKFQFKLNEQKLQSLGITSVNLYHNDQKTSMVFIKSDGQGYSYYESTVTEFGDYIIGEIEEKPITVPEVKTTVVEPVIESTSQTVAVENETLTSSTPTTSVPLVGKATDQTVKKSSWLSRLIDR